MSDDTSLKTNRRRPRIWRTHVRRISDWFAREHPTAPGQWLGRFVLLRLLGLMYLMAFLTLVNQGPALLGPHGLLPIADYLDDIAAHVGSRAGGFWELPSVFWLGDSVAAVRAVGWTGVALSMLVLAGYANGLILLALCALQISIAHVGQTFYGFGWELQLVETGFLCAFLCPFLDGRPFARRPSPIMVVWLLRWLAVRIMWGAGLIKLRGDPCWRDLTCLDFHFETQPIPNPLTPFFHALPAWAHKVGVLFNHIVELAVPFFVFGTRPMRIGAGMLLASLQVILILSGNLSFLNWLTLIPILACFDDSLWRRILPRFVVASADRARAVAVPSRAQGTGVALICALVVVLSVPPLLNLLSGRQMMNTSFTRLPLVNTYGAFGTVGRERAQLVFEGTDDETPTPDTHWRRYEFKCQPGDPARRPCWMSPYHYRLDWLLWFAAMGEPRDYPWTVHLVWKLLDADQASLALLDVDPFAGARPRFIRVDLYRYRLTPRGSPIWWERQRRSSWLPPLGRDDPGLQDFARRRGWTDAP